MKIAAVQMVSTPQLERNLETAGRLIAEAAAEGARLVALPEYFCIFGRSDRDKLAVAEAAGDGPIQEALARAAREHGVWIIGGTLPMRIPGNTGQVRNACCVVAPDGRQVARYDKMHLFSFDNGSERHEEATTLEAGTEAVAFDIADPDGDGSGALRVGLSVCYDLRFPELYRALTPPSRPPFLPPGGPPPAGGSRALHATSLRFPPRSPTPRGRPTGNCCCARGPSRTRPTSSRRRRAGGTRTAAAPGVTA